MCLIRTLITNANHLKNRVDDRLFTVNNMVNGIQDAKKVKAIASHSAHLSLYSTAIRHTFYVERRLSASERERERVGNSIAHTVSCILCGTSIGNRILRKFRCRLVDIVRLFLVR